MSGIEELTNEQLIEKYRLEEDTFLKEEIRDTFFVKNKKLAPYVAQTYIRSNIHVEDLISIGNIGMLKAFNTFKLESGWKFMTYATRVMHNEVLMELRKTKKLQLVDSLDATVFNDPNGGTEMSLLDFMSDPNVDIEKQAESSEIVRLVKTEGKNFLSEKEHFIILDFLSDSPETQRSLSEQMNVSQSYVSRLREQALKKIKLFLSGDNVIHPAVRKPIKKERKLIMHSQREEKKLNIPEGTLYDKVKYMYENFPGMAIEEVSEKLGANKGSVYAYLNKVKKEAKAEIKVTPPKVDKIHVPDAPSVKEDPVIIFRESAPETAVEEKIVFVPEEIKESVPSPSLVSLSMEDTSPESIRYMLEHLSRTLQGSETYSLTISITKHQNKEDYHETSSVRGLKASNA